MTVRHDTPHHVMTGNDSPGVTVNFSLPQYTANEDSQSVDYTVNVIGSLDRDVSVKVSDVPGTAKSKIFHYYCQ